MPTPNTPGDHCDDTRPIDRVGFRVSALFVILLTSLIGTLFPIITKRVKYLRKRVPGVVFEFGKYVPLLLSSVKTLILGSLGVV
jgi:hypothetical protein